MKKSVKLVSAAVLAFSLSGAALAVKSTNIPYLYVYASYGNPVSAVKVLPGSVAATSANSKVGLPQNYNVVNGDKNAGLVTVTNSQSSGQLGVKLSYSVKTPSQGYITCPVTVTGTIGTAPVATVTDPTGMCMPLFQPVYSVGSDKSPVVTVNWKI